MLLPLSLAPFSFSLFLSLILSLSLISALFLLGQINRLCAVKLVFGVLRQYHLLSVLKFPLLNSRITFILALSGAGEIMCVLTVQHMHMRQHDCFFFHMKGANQVSSQPRAWPWDLGCIPTSLTVNHIADIDQRPSSSSSHWSKWFLLSIPKREDIRK